MNAPRRQLVLSLVPFISGALLSITEPVSANPTMCDCVDVPAPLWTQSRLKEYDPFGYPRCLPEQKGKWTWEENTFVTVAGGGVSDTKPLMPFGAAIIAILPGYCVTGSLTDGSGDEDIILVLGNCDNECEVDECGNPPTKPAPGTGVNNPYYGSGLFPDQPGSSHKWNSLGPEPKDWVFGLYNDSHPDSIPSEVPFSDGAIFGVTSSVVYNPFLVFTDRNAGGCLPTVKTYTANRVPSQYYSNGHCSAATETSPDPGSVPPDESYNGHSYARTAVSTHLAFDDAHALTASAVATKSSWLGAYAPSYVAGDSVRVKTPTINFTLGGAITASHGGNLSGVLGGAINYKIEAPFVTAEPPVPLRRDVQTGWGGSAVGYAPALSSAVASEWLLPVQKFSPNDQVCYNGMGTVDVVAQTMAYASKCPVGGIIVSADMDVEITSIMVGGFDYVEQCE